MPFTTTRHQSHKAPRKLEAKAFASVCLAPWTEGFAKAGSVFWPLFGPAKGNSYIAGSDSGATWRTPVFASGDFFFIFFRLTAALAQASVPVVLGAESPAAGI